MLDAEDDHDHAPDRMRLGRSFRRIGQAGFWAQILLAIIPVVVGSAAFMVSTSVNAPGSRFGLVGYLAIASFVILLFTTLWFRRYIRIGARLEADGGAMSPKALLRTVWTGLIASSCGILLSIVVTIFEVGYLLFRFLEAPQGGVPVIQTGGDAAWISAIDVLSLLALVFTMAAEIIVLVLGLLLLSRVWAAQRPGAPSGSE